MKKKSLLLFILITIISLNFMSCDLFMNILGANDPHDLYFWTLVEEYEELNENVEEANSIPLEYTLYDDTLIIITKGENDETDNDPPGYNSKVEAESAASQTIMSFEEVNNSVVITAGDMTVKEHQPNNDWHISTPYTLIDPEKNVVYSFEGSAITGEEQTNSSLIKIKFK